MNVLINGVGGPTPRSIARSLRWFSNDSYQLIGTDINTQAYGLYEKDLYDETFIIPGAGKEGYWEAIEEIIAIHHIEYAIVMPELEVLEWAKKAVLPCKALIPNAAITELLLDKAAMTKVLSPELVPESYAFSPDNIDYQELELRLPYPFWIRSTSGSSGLGSLKVENRASLQNWININPDVNAFIASTFLSGRNLAVKLLYHKGKLIRSACGERVNYIMAKVAPSGITGNTSFGRLLNDTALVDVAVRTMDELFEHTGAEKHGFFTVDLKEDDQGKPYITEVNVRHVAFSICFAAAGANFAEDTLRLLSDDPGFDKTYKQYQFEEGTIFLRDVDALPILMKEGDLLKKINLRKM